MKKLLTGAVLASALIATAADAADYTLKFGHPANEENIWNKAALKFKDVVEQNSNGRIEVKVYPNSQLGKEMDLINSIQLGTADMTVSGESLQNWAPKAAMLAVPYAFRDSDHLHKAVEGEIGREIEQQITEQTGLVPLAYFERGARELTSNRPIRSPEDLNGMILRVPNVPLFVNVWQSLGAKPTPMAFSEVFTSLQQGTIAGQENPLSLIKSASFFEVQKYVNRTDHVRSWIYVVIGQRQLEKLPEDLQKVVIQAAQEMQAYEHEMFAKDQHSLEADLKAKGMEFVEVDTEAFMNKAKAAVLDALNDEQKALYEQIQAL